MTGAGYRVVVSDVKRPDLAVEREVFAGRDVALDQGQYHSEAAVVEAARDAHGLVCDSGTPVTADVLDACPSLLVVVRAGVGLDNVDVAAATERDVHVCHVPDYAVDEVSTHACGLLLGLARRLFTYRADVRAGNWDWQAAPMPPRLADRTLGVVAFGRIGSRAAEKAAPFFGETVVDDPYVEDATIRAAGFEPVGFEELLARADAVTVHTPLTEETRGLFDADAFAAMGEDVLLVNTSRGGVVDEAALLAALADGTVAGAGLDVLATEPPADRELVEHPRVAVTPHVAWYSAESADEVRRTAARQVLSVLDGEEPAHAVEPGRWGAAALDE